jgi:hypothetical protein
LPSAGGVGMSGNFSGGHNQLFGARATGLAGTWERAAQQEVLDTMRHEKIGRCKKPVWRVPLPAVVGTVVLVVTCVLSWVMAGALVTDGADSTAMVATPARNAG